MRAAGLAHNFISIRDIIITLEKIPKVLFVLSYYANYQKSDFPT